MRLFFYYNFKIQWRKSMSNGKLNYAHKKIVTHQCTSTEKDKCRTFKKHSSVFAICYNQHLRHGHHLVASVYGNFSTQSKN